MQRYSTYRGLRSAVAAVLVVVVWGASADAQDASPPKVSTLLNLSPPQSWIHLFCEETTDPCAVTFWCGQQTGAPVTWNIPVEPGQIFGYFPGKMEGGRVANFEAALVDASLSEEDARRRTTCVVRSNHQVEARAYTRIAGEFVPVANRATILPATTTTDAPADQAPNE